MNDVMIYVRISARGGGQGRELSVSGRRVFAHYDALLVGGGCCCECFGTRRVCLVVLPLLACEMAAVLGAIIL